MEAARLLEQKSNIFDEQIPNDSSPILQSTHWRPSNFAAKSKQNIKKFFTKCMQKIKDFGEWLLDYIPPKPKVVESFKKKIKKLYEKSDTLFQPTQYKSALKNFAIQYRIKGSNGYDPESFLLNYKAVHYKPYDKLTTNQS